MLQAMGYAVAVTAALTVVALCLERLAGLHGLTRRTGWVAVMLLSVLLPVTMVLGSPAAAPGVTASAHSHAAASPAGAALLTPAEQQPIWKLAAPSDGQVIAMWGVASVGFALYLLGASLLLRLRAARWQRTTVLGHEVLISEVTGPALLGVLAPRIVVPRWLLQQPVPAQTLILEHERQHMKARDPLLMVAGLFLIAAVPWNPFLWWQWRRMRHAMEMDCDARVLKTGAAADTYAEVLLEVTRRATRMFPGALAMSEPVAALEQRIDHLMPKVVRHARLQAAGVLGLAAAGASMALALNAPALPMRTPAIAVDATPITATPVSKAASSGELSNKEVNMKKPTSIAVTAAALGAAAVAQAQVPEQGPIASDRQATAQQVIASNDLNKDGIVTKEEATTANKTLILMWNFYDMDRDGTVHAAEVDRATNAMVVATAEEKITGERSSGPAMVKPDQVITSNDQDGDGIVTRDEAMKVGKGLARLWDAYDIDKDGKVDVAEIAKAQGY